METLIWSEGMTVWAAASSTKEFGITSVPPPIPVSPTPPLIPQQDSSSPPPIPITSIPQTPPTEESKKDPPSVQSKEKSSNFMPVFVLILLSIFFTGGVVYIAKNPELLKSITKKSQTIEGIRIIITDIRGGEEGFTLITKNGEYYIYTVNAILKGKSDVVNKIHSIAEKSKVKKIPVIISKTKEYDLGYTVSFDKDN
jgi:hypothetical protein